MSETPDPTTGAENKAFSAIMVTGNDPIAYTEAYSSGNGANAVAYAPNNDGDEVTTF